MHLEAIFYEIDEFCKQFETEFKAHLLSVGSGRRKRAFRMSLSEIMTIAIWYHQSGYQNFKSFYTKHVLVHMKCDFNQLVSYNRFVELKNSAMLPLMIFAQLCSLGKCTGISFIDSFALKACHTRRISSNKVFKNVARRGKTSVGWFYGFKLHLIMNHRGEIISFCLTPGNVADNNEHILIRLTKKVYGKLFGDKGYLVNPKLFEKLHLKGVQLVTKVRKNMKNKILSMFDKFCLRKRGVIESLGAILKESCGLEHTRHRSVIGFFSHIASCLIAYSFREKKPSIIRVKRIKGYIS